MKKLYRTTIVIWSEEDPNDDLSLSDIAREAETGNSYCSSLLTELVEEPTKDPAWDGTEFFGCMDDQQ